MSTRYRSATQSWVFGPYALYADNPLHAREAYERLCKDVTLSVPFGTVTLDGGEEVDWVHIRAAVKAEEPFH